MKISIIGAGNVGSALALKVLEDNLSDIALIDINEDLAYAKALDLEDAAGVLGCRCSITAGSDYNLIKDSYCVVVTAGFARRPGMDREDLLLKNASVIKEVVGNIKKYTPTSIILMVTNPLDVMTYLALKISGFDKSKVLGMAGILDSGRLSVVLSNRLNKNRDSLKSLVLGTHGDSMVPIEDEVTVEGAPLNKFLKEDEIEEVFKEARARGGKIVSLLKGGSAYYAPAASVYRMLKVMINDSEDVLPCSVYLDGEYNLKDVCLGVPVKLGKDGVREIISVILTEEEEISLQKASEIVKTGIKKII